MKSAPGQEAFCYDIYMKNAILLHGLVNEAEYYDTRFPSASNSHWFPWLQKQLLVHDIKADTPEIPKPFDMNWESWAKEVERYDITEETILLGHSMGGGFWVRYLSERTNLKVGKVVLVAPWLNLENSENTDFFDFEIATDLTDRVKSLTIFNSDNDGKEVHNSVKLIKSKVPKAEIKQFHDYGHFCFNDMGTYTFPELAEALVS